MSVALLLLAALAAQSPAAAAPPVTTSTSTAAAAPTATKVKLSNASEKICKTDQERGSRIATRTCRTRAEWDALEAGAREFLKERRDLANPGR